MPPPPSRYILAFLLLGCCCWSRAVLGKAVRFDEHDEDAYTKMDSSDSHKREPFSYREPWVWSLNFPACNGQRQSPIDIDINRIEGKKIEDNPLKGQAYDAPPVKMEIKNNGHTVVVSGEWPFHSQPKIRGGPLEDSYTFHQLHYHWSDSNCRGSEHTFENESYPMEIHFVHYKTMYESYDNAVNRTDGIAVVAFFFTIDTIPNPGLEGVRPHLQNIQLPYQIREIMPIPLSTFGMNPFLEGYVTYRGSLTTPPCYESVIWILARSKIMTVTIEQVKALREIIMVDKIRHNYRRIQPLNGREIYHYSQDFY